MEKVVTVVGKNGVEYTVLLTAEETDYYLHLAQLRASSPGDVMKEFSDLIMSKSQEAESQDKSRYN
ncbi:MAG: hypothetical protein NVS4B12_26990 [Ktedonobacteraceae bacterium]